MPPCHPVGYIYRHRHLIFHLDSPLPPPYHTHHATYLKQGPSTHMLNREALRPRYFAALEAVTNVSSAKLNKFLSAFCSGDDTLSLLQKATGITRPTAIRWRNIVRDVDTKVETIEEIQPLSDIDSGKRVADEILIDTTSRDYVLESLGWALKQARDTNKPDQVARISRQMSDIQGFKAKEMGRVYDPIQELGDEGLAAVDHETSMRILAIGEHIKHFPESVAAIANLGLKWRDEALTSDNNEPKLPPSSKPPQGTNDALDAESPTPVTDRIAEQHAAPTDRPFDTLSSYSDPPDDEDGEGLPDGPIVLDPVLSDLKGDD